VVISLQDYWNLLESCEIVKHLPRLCFGSSCEIVDYLVSNSGDNISSVTM